MKLHQIKCILLCTCSLLFISQKSNAQHHKVILAIFAHPDDEQTISPVLVKYAAAGATIFIAVATDGRFGFASHYALKNPDSLVMIREAEMKCVTRSLGVNDAIFLGFQDQFRMKDGLDTLGIQFNLMRDKVIKLFADLKPDIVITWGPSGLTGHPDHRMVSDVVTGVFSMKRWNKPANLFYTELASGGVEKNRFGLITVDSNYLNVRIVVTKEEMAKARIAWNCHKSQYTSAVTDELQSLFWTSQKGIAYFRSFRFSDKRMENLFSIE